MRLTEASTSAGVMRMNPSDGHAASTATGWRPPSMTAIRPGSEDPHRPRPVAMTTSVSLNAEERLRAPRSTPLTTQAPITSPAPACAAGEASAPEPDPITHPEDTPMEKSPPSRAHTPTQRGVLQTLQAAPGGKLTRTELAAAHPELDEAALSNALYNAQKAGRMVRDGKGPSAVMGITPAGIAFLAACGERGQVQPTRKAKSARAAVKPAKVEAPYSQDPAPTVLTTGRTVTISADQVEPTGPIDHDPAFDFAVFRSGALAIVHDGREILLSAPQARELAQALRTAHA